MTTATQAIPHQQSSTIPRLQPLLAVMTWELRRLRASRATWLLPPSALLLFLLIRWTQREPTPWGPLSVYDHALLRFTFSNTIDSASPWALTATLPPTLVFLLAVTLPFVCADGVALDLKRRTHELLMTTSLPTWAYVLGRYLIVLGLSLGLAVLLLVAILGLALALHLGLGGAGQPTPRVGPVLVSWAALLLPTIILVSSLSFALGTVLPRRSLLVKLGIMVGWFIGAVIVPGMPVWQEVHHAVWYEDWDPTSVLLALAFHYDHAFTQASLQLAPHPSNEQLLRLFQGIEYQQPDLWAWLGPHLLWASLGLALVGIAVGGFKRFGDVSN